MRILLWFLLLLPILSFAEPRKAITTGRKTSRLGDRLADYAHVKWVSYKWNIPFLYKPFKYSSELVLDSIEEHFNKQKAATFAAELPVTDISLLDKRVTEDTLFILNHFPDSYDEYQFLNWKQGPYIHVDWNDKKFLSMMRALIKPKKALPLIVPDTASPSVAIHYRTGEGYDTLQARRKRLMAFPPLEYYLEQLKTLHSLIGHDKQIYVFIFTDHPDPVSIVKLFEAKTASKLIQFDCRKNGNSHDANVLEDLFSMMQFDCLIRPISHYSSIASHLGEFKIDISPKHAYWDKKAKQLVIDQVHIKQKRGS